MKLTDAAKHFNNTTFKDAYAPLTSFKGKLMAFDDATRDSLSTERRLMSVAPQVTIPARRVVKTGVHAWLVGDLAVDYTGDTELRNKYVLHKATEIALVRTFEEALLGTGTKNLWAARLWSKSTKETDESSGMYGHYQIFFARGEELRDPQYLAGTTFDGREYNVLVFIDSKWHLVRTSVLTAGGFLEAIADEMPDPVVTSVSYTKYARNPVTEVSTPTTTAKAAIMLRWQSNFTYFSQFSAKYENGDAQMLVLNTGLTPSTADTLVLQGRTYKVVSFFSQGNCWSLHVRRA